MRPVAIYARVSSTGERQSTDRQVADLTAYAGAAGLDVVRVFREKGSGAIEDRPVLKECIAFCEENNTDLLVTEVSRLGRSVKIIVNTVDELTKAGVNIHILDLRLQTMPDGQENPVAKMMLTILGLGAELERKSIVSRLNSGRELAKAKGVKMGRKKGYKVSDEEILAKYPEVVRKLRKGAPIRDIAKVCEVSTSTVQKVKAILGLKGKKGTPEKDSFDAANAANKALFFADVNKRIDEDAWTALLEMRAIAAEAGIQDMSLDEINAEIQEVRKGN